MRVSMGSYLKVEKGVGQGEWNGSQEAWCLKDSMGGGMYYGGGEVYASQ